MIEALRRGDMHQKDIKPQPSKEPEGAQPNPTSNPRNVKRSGEHLLLSSAEACGAVRRCRQMGSPNLKRNLVVSATGP